MLQIVMEIVIKDWKKIGFINSLEVESLLMKTISVLAQIKMESLVKAKAIFSWNKTATNGSSFCTKEKKLLTNKLVMES